MYLWGIAGVVAAGEKSPGRVLKMGARRIVAIPAEIALIAVAVLLGVQDFAYAEVGDAVDAKDLAGAKRALERATSFGVGLPGYELWGSQEMAKLKAWDEARTASALAEKRGEDRASAAYQSSILQVVNGDAVSAEAKASEAIRLAPNWYKPHLLRAQILQAMGRNEEAAREARESLNLGWKGK